MNPHTLFNVIWATFLGIVIGALPGLTATMGVALLTTLTFSMPHNEAIMVLICIYVGAIYGGSRSAILLNIPGTPASAASTLDGYPLARQGLAGRAMGISTSGSWLGTLFGILCLALLTPCLSELALTFQSFEFFWISLFGVVVAGTLAGGDPLKGYIAGFLGLWIATIGQEPYYNYQRYAFGFTDLAGGIGLLPALVGAYGVAEVLQAMRGPAVKAISSKPQFGRPAHRGRARNTGAPSSAPAPSACGSAFFPGLGEDAAAWSSYAAARRASKEKEKYGKGSIEGLMAAETGRGLFGPRRHHPRAHAGAARLGAGGGADGGHDDPRAQSRAPT